MKFRNVRKCGTFAGGYVLLPEAIYGEEPASGGVRATDTLLIVTAWPYSDDSVLAFATHCAQDQHGRPVLGMINIRPYIADLPRAKALNIVLHEVMHGVFLFAWPADLRCLISSSHFLFLQKVLVFNGALYEDFVGYDSAAPETAAARTVRLENNELVPALRTPKAVAEARRFFACEQLNSVLLEEQNYAEQGYSGALPPHLERRVFDEDLMTAFAFDVPFLSRMNMAVMEVK